MKMSPISFYLLWTSLKIVILNFAIILLTDLNPSFFAVLLFVLFFQISVLFPIFTIVSSSKNENR